MTSNASYLCGPRASSVAVGDIECEAPAAVTGKGMRLCEHLNDNDSFLVLDPQVHAQIFKASPIFTRQPSLSKQVGEKSKTKKGHRPTPTLHRSLSQLLASELRQGA